MALYSKLEAGLFQYVPYVQWLLFVVYNLPWVLNKARVQSSIPRAVSFFTPCTSPPHRPAKTCLRRSWETKTPTWTFRWRYVTNKSAYYYDICDYWLLRQHLVTWSSGELHGDLLRACEGPTEPEVQGKPQSEVRGPWINIPNLARIYTLPPLSDCYSGSILSWDRTWRAWPS